MNSAELHVRAAKLDAEDPLAPFRDRFALPVATDGSPALYLCGHSLGPMPLAARNLVAAELQDWAQLAVRGHHEARRPWIDYAPLLQPALAELAGARESEVVAMNSLTIDLHLLMASFYRPAGRRRCIVVEQGAFSSDRHAVVSQIQWHGLDAADTLIEIAPAPGADLIDAAAVESLLQARGDEIALVLWPGVQYRTGQVFDTAGIVDAAHRAGAVCGLDLAHAIGNVPLHLHDEAVDFAVWCGYKYLNGGPGAVGGAFVNARHDRARLPGLAGWWGHEPATRFQMAPGFVPAAGAAGWQVSNPPILSTAPLLASLQIFQTAGMQRLREKSLRMTALLLQQIEQRFAASVEVITPRSPVGHGCQLSLRLRAGRERGRAVFQQLGRLGVIADWREPDILRIAPAPLYNQYSELARFCDALATALEAAA